MGGLRVDSVKAAGSGTLIVSAGEGSFCIVQDQAESLGLRPEALVPGALLDDEALELLALAAEAREAGLRGLALLARAEQSAFMLKSKLEARGFSRRAVALALERLEAEGLLDDRRFAAAYAVSRLGRGGSKPEGPASLAAALAERGVERPVAAEAIAAVLGPAERAAALAEAARRLSGRLGGPGKEGRGALRAALRSGLRELGFKSDEIDRYFEEDGDGSL